MPPVEHEGHRLLIIGCVEKSFQDCVMLLLILPPNRNIVQIRIHSLEVLVPNKVHHFPLKASHAVCDTKRKTYILE